MKVPRDIFECRDCGASRTRITCESCWEAICICCADLVFVERGGEEAYHVLCKDCLGVEP